MFLSSEIVGWVWGGFGKEIEGVGGGWKGRTGLGEGGGPRVDESRERKRERSKKSRGRKRRAANEE